MKRRVGAALSVLALALASCRDEPAPNPPVPGASSEPSGTGAVGANPVEASAVKEEAERQGREAVSKSMNPKGLPPYSGPVGGVRGIVKVVGDPPPLVPEMVSVLPAEGCPRAHELQRRLYRQGTDRTLADVLVTVTEYTGFVEPKQDATRVEIKGCAFDAKVLGMVFGQRLDVFNLDNQAYMPRLVGTPTYALRVAMPGGSPVPLFAPRAGPFILADQTREYVRADLYVLNYPTFDVTGLDGEFKIEGVPSGEAKVTAFVPGFGKVLSQRVKVQAGSLEDVAFEFTFSESEYQTQSRAAAQEKQGPK